jgi:hypothetical protein
VCSVQMGTGSIERPPMKPAGTAYLRYASETVLGVKERSDHCIRCRLTSQTDIPVLRFFHHVCYDKSRNERADFYRRFCQERLQSGAKQASSALYANLANALFVRIYAKLIPRLGT